MFDRFLHRHPSARTVAARMMAARRAGAGLYLREWRLSDADLDPAPAAAFVDAVIGWLRDTLATARRPHGIDQFEFAIACAPCGAGAPVSVRFPRLRPMDLYRPERVADRLYAFLCDQRGAGESFLVAGALYSWGDAAHAALPSVS